jgi:hypothetical protein
MSTILPQVPAGMPVVVQPGPCGIAPAELDAIVKAAEEVFGTSVVPQLEEDPEIDESYYQLRVKVVRDVDAVARLRRRWYEVLWQLAPSHCHSIRLAVDYSS